METIREKPIGVVFRALVDTRGSLLGPQDRAIERHDAAGN
jgi:hypothetical protein